MLMPINELTAVSTLCKFTVRELDTKFWRIKINLPNLPNVFHCQCFALYNIKLTLFIISTQDSFTKLKMLLKLPSAGSNSGFWV